MPTIKDVAGLAGVSIKTVSRVMNNEPHVRDALRNRVASAARTLAYRPNQSARRLAGNRSYLIAYLYDNPNSAYVATIQDSLARRCREVGYHLVVEPIQRQLPSLIEICDRLIDTLAPDGVVLTPPVSENVELIAHVVRRRVKVVRIAALNAGATCNIFVDERAAARSMTEYLIKLGHRHIAMVRGHPEHRQASKRFDGYRDALFNAGIRLDTRLVVQGYFDVQSGIDSGRALLKLRRRPTAVFAANDEMALGVMIAAREHELQIPRSLSVAGFDDTPMTRHLWPALTTIRQPIEQMGVAAVNILISDTKPRKEVLLPFDLIVRDSTAPPG